MRVVRYEREEDEELFALNRDGVYPAEDVRVCVCGRYEDSCSVPLD